jgi:hypothetical protein
MKKIGFFSVLLLGLALSTQAQQNTDIKFPGLDKSPLDVTYFPVNTTKSKEPTSPVLRVLYSRPQKNGREIFGVLEPFGKVWRMGANESTELDVFKTINIGGKNIKPGRYSMFAIPEADKWTIIVNKQIDKWGAFSYNQNEDLVRVEVPVGKTAKTQEAFAITFVEVANGATMILAWDNTQIEIPVLIKK